MKDRGARFILIGAGVTAALLFLEAALRLLGPYYYDRRQKAEQAVLQKDFEYAAAGEKAAGAGGAAGDELRILCVGDSHTFGMGAEPGYSYPAQLQRMLDRSGHACRVYNLGVPGMTALKLRQRLPYLLERYRPQILVLLIGLNDTSYPFVSDLYEMHHFDRDPLLTKAVGPVLRSRVFRLGEYIAGGLKKKLLTARGKRFDPSARAQAEGYVNMAVIAFKEGDVSRAEHSFRQAEKADPEDERIYLQKAQYYQSLDRFDDCLRECAKVIEINPYSEYRRDLYRLLFLLYQQLSHSAEYRDRVRRIMGRIPSDDRFQSPGRPFLLEHSIVAEVFQRNADQIVALAQQHRVTLILQTYARVGGFISSELRKTAARHSLRLADNEKTFERLKDPLAYFAPGGGHPNGEGYRLVAAEVYRKVMEAVRESGPGKAK